MKLLVQSAQQILIQLLVLYNTRSFKCIAMDWQTENSSVLSDYPSSIIEPFEFNLDPPELLSQQSGLSNDSAHAPGSSPLCQQVPTISEALISPGYALVLLGKH